MRPAAWLCLMALAGCQAREAAPASRPDGSEVALLRSWQVDTVLHLDEWRLIADCAPSNPDRENGHLKARRGSETVEVNSAAALSALVRSPWSEANVREFYRLVDLFVLDQGVPGDAWRENSDPRWDLGIQPWHEEPDRTESILPGTEETVVVRTVFHWNRWARIQARLQPGTYSVSSVTEK